MSNWIKLEMRNTLHWCVNMGLYKKIMLDSSRVWEIRESSTQEILSGTGKEWRLCPYCGISFYEDEKKEADAK